MRGLQQHVLVHLDDPDIESALGLVVPFGVYLIGELAHTSGVLAVVVAGLYLGYHAPQSGYATRLQEQAVWRASDTILESVVFALIGPNYDRNNPLLTPPEPLTARHRLPGYKLVNDAELMEFGFIQSDFF